MDFSPQEGFLFLFHWPAEERRDTIYLVSFSISNYDICLSVLALFKYTLHGRMHSSLLLSKLVGYELAGTKAVYLH